MGMPIVVDVRDDGDIDDARSTRCSTGSAGSTRPSARTSRTARSAASTAASSRSRTRTRRCAACSSAARSCARETDGYFDARAAAPRRSTRRPRQGLVGRPRRGDPRRRRACANYAVNAGGDMRAAGRAARAAGASASSIRPSATRSRRSSRRADLGGRHIGRVRARRSTSSTRTPRRPPARRALGHDHRPGSRDGRRVRDRRVRDGRQRGPHWTARALAATRR